MVDLGPEEHEQGVGGEEEEPGGVHEGGARGRVGQGVDLAPNGEHTGAERRADKVQEVEHLLRRPPVAVGRVVKVSGGAR